MLPDNGTAWPPTELAGVTEKLNEYSAWYANDTTTLGELYSKPERNRRKGVIGTLRRWFLGEQAPTAGKPVANIHMNLAQEIARTSANLLLSEPVQISSEDQTTQDRLDLVAGPELDAVLVSAAETTAALGGVYLKTAWDSEVADNAFIVKVDADYAFPTFRYGRLTEVTFWRVVETRNTIVYRHLEHHTTDQAGVGVVEHGLYEGTEWNLGTRRPLPDHPATEGLAVDQDSVISTLTPGLDVVYWPNLTPSAQWRTHTVGAYLGRSDYEGIEQQLDALDELHSSWLRDIRLGKGRLVVPDSFLDDLGYGEGMGFDLDRSIFTPVKAPPGSAADERMQIENVQFDIRTEDHERAIEYFKKSILGSAGYSPQTFGIAQDGGAVTATEITARERTSFMTRDRKIRPAKPALETIVTKALLVDAAVFSTGVTDPVVDVVFADSVQPDPEAISRQNQADYSSLSASIDTRVRRANTDKDEEWIAAEVARIEAENNVAPVEDPDTLGVDGVGLSDSFERVPDDQAQ